LRIRFAVVELRDGMAAGDLTEVAGLALTAAKLDDGRTTTATSAT
jgi:hypothetical protein